MSVSQTMEQVKFNPHTTTLILALSYVTAHMAARFHR